MKAHVLFWGIPLLIYSCNKNEVLSTIPGEYEVIDTRQFVGTGISSVHPKDFSYVITLSDVEKDSLFMTNLFEHHTPIIVKIDGDNLTIASQNMEPGVTVSGTGAIIKEDISVSYEVESPDGISYCSLVGIKKKPQ